MEGRFIEALREAELAQDLDPLGSIARFNLIRCLYFAAALMMLFAWQRKLLERSGIILTRFCLPVRSSAVWADMRRQLTLRKCVALIGKNSQTLSRLGSAQAKAGDTQAAQMVLQDMHEIALRRYISPYHLALVNCSLGRAELWICWSRPHESRTGRILWMAVDPELDVLHGHPRFDELLAKLNHRLSAESATRDLSEGIRYRTQPVPRQL